MNKFYISFDTGINNVCYAYLCANGWRICGNVIAKDKPIFLISLFQVELKHVRTKETKSGLCIDHAISVDAIRGEREDILADKHGVNYTLFCQTEVHTNADTFTCTKRHPGGIYIIWASSFETRWIERIWIFPVLVKMVNNPKVLRNVTKFSSCVILRICSYNMQQLPSSCQCLLEQRICLALRPSRHIAAGYQMWEG